MKQARVIEALVKQRSLIVTAAVAGPAVLSALLAAMMASVANWSYALVLGAVAVAGGAAVWFTRRPVGVLRFDAERRALSYAAGDASTLLGLGQAFTVDATIKISSIPSSALRGDPSMVVTVTQAPRASRSGSPGRCASSPRSRRSRPRNRSLRFASTGEAP